MNDSSQHNIIVLIIPWDKGFLVFSFLIVGITKCLKKVMKKELSLRR